MVNRIDQRHDEKRAALRFIGPTKVAVGIHFTVIGIAAFALSIWFAYDGLVAYPEMNVRYDKFIELQTKGISDLWADLARSKGWPVEQPATRKSDFDIRVQFIQMGICAFFGVAAFAWLGWLGIKAAGADVVNYMATETKGAIREISAAVGQGLRSAETPEGSPQIARCPQCHADNEISANFCKACGVPLPKSKPCPDCRQINDPDARFCDNCGKTIA